MATNEVWGSWTDAERWREALFKERSAVARLAWLEEVWQLRKVGRRFGGTHTTQDSESKPAVLHKRP